MARDPHQNSQRLALDELKLRQLNRTGDISIRRNASVRWAGILVQPLSGRTRDCPETEEEDQQTDQQPSPSDEIAAEVDLYEYRGDDHGYKKIGTRTAYSWLLPTGQKLPSGTPCIVERRTDGRWYVERWEPTVYALDQCGEEETPTEYTITELCEAVGKVVRIDGTCYQVRLPDTDELDLCTETPCVEWDGPYDDCDECSGCYRLTECNPADPDNPTVYLASSAVDTDLDPVDLGDHVGEVVRLPDGDGTCCLVEEVDSTSDTEGGGCEDAIAVAIYEAYDSCSECLIYTMTKCSDSSTITTWSDLAAYSVGDVLRREEDGECYTLTSSSETWDGNSVAFTVEAEYESCDDCTGSAYLLTHDCSDCESTGTTEPDIVTEEELQEAVGKFVRVAGHCYSVAEAPSEADVTDPTLDYEGPFDDCDGCLAEPVTTTKRVVTRVKSEGGQLLAEVEEWTITDGLVTGFCRLDDEYIADDCCESSST